MRWFVEISPLPPSEGPKVKWCVEAAGWQPALKDVRALRGEEGPLSGISIELLDDGARAIDPALRTRYVIREAPASTPLTHEKGAAPAKAEPIKTDLAKVEPTKTDLAKAPPAKTDLAKVEPTKTDLTKAEPTKTDLAKAPPAKAEPTKTDLAKAPPAKADVASATSKKTEPEKPLPAFEVQSSREENPSAASPLTYREQVLVVDPALSDADVERLIRARFQAIEASLASAKPGRFVNLAVFDHRFTGKPSRRPRATLAWKDWRGAPEVRFPAAEATGSSPPSFSAPTSASQPVPQPSSRTATSAPASQAPATPAPSPAKDVSAPAKDAPAPAKDAPAPAKDAPAPAKDVPAPAKDVPAPAKEAAPSPAASTPAAPPVVEPKAQPAPSADPPTVVVSADAPTVVAPVDSPTVSAPTSPSLPPTEPVPTPLAPTQPAPKTAPEPASKSTPEPASKSTPEPASKSTPEKQDRKEAAPPKDERPSLPVSAAPKTKPAATPAPAPAPAPREPFIPAVKKASEVGPRQAGDELIGELFEACGDLTFLRDSLEGADFVLSLALEKMPSELGLVSLFDINRREFVVIRQAGGARSIVLSRLSERAGLAQPAMRKRAAVVVPDASAEPRALDDRFRTLGIELKSMMIAPVEQSGRYLGLIELVNPLDNKPFTEGDGHALTYIGEQYAEFVAGHGVILDPQTVIDRHQKR